MPQSQWITLLVAATVAGVVLVRLFMILGRRTGAEPQLPPSRWLGGAAPSAEAAPPALPGAPGLFEIQVADRSFDAAKFLGGARAAYGQIVTAFEKGDRAALKPLVSDDVLQAFEAAITARGEAPSAYNFAAVNEAHIVSGSVAGGIMEITVSFTAGFDTPGAIGAPHLVTDVWSFTRPAGASDPNWTLVSTAGETA
jgi:predicted lipid-binding transport protein (Tim44 family)